VFAARGAARSRTATPKALTAFDVARDHQPKLNNRACAAFGRARRRAL
jgi:hypothetical protein